MLLLTWETTLSGPGQAGRVVQVYSTSGSPGGFRSLARPMRPLPVDPLCQTRGGGSVGRLAVKRCALCPAGQPAVTAALSRRWVDGKVGPGGTERRPGRRGCEASSGGVAGGVVGVVVVPEAPDV